MHEQRIARLEASFSALKPMAGKLADTFYAELFQRHPAVRTMFPPDMKEQKQKLMAAVATVVASLRVPSALVGPLAEMGKRHVDYGAEAGHYPVVRDVFLHAMAEVGGDVWSPELEEDWRAALNTVAELMLEGAKGVKRKAA